MCFCGLPPVAFKGYVFLTAFRVMEMLVACPSCGWLGAGVHPLLIVGPYVDRVPGYLPLQHLSCVIKEKMPWMRC